MNHEHRTFGFAALLAVMGVSIVFGMILGGRLNAPPVMLAATAAPWPVGEATAAATLPTGGAAREEFADIAERSLPAVVSVTSTSRGAETDAGQPLSEDDFFRRFWFFRDTPEPQEPDERRVGSGSGFIISPDGYVMTNNHVIEDFEKVEVSLTDGRTFPARVVGRDPSIDLALLKIDTGDEALPTLPFGNSDAVRVGEWVLAIGNPHEFDHTVTVGVISGKERRVPLPTTDIGVVSFIQTDAAVNLGNSGGPLLDARGNVIGINTAIRRHNYAEGISFALPINQARDVIDQLRQHGAVRRGWIGIRMNDVGIDEATRDYYQLPDAKGVLVTSVEGGGPAARAGLKAGDVIRQVDGSQVGDNLDMIGKISSHQPGDKVRLTVFRGGRSIEIVATLGDRESALEAGSGEDAPPEPSEREREPEASSGLGLTVEGLDATSRRQLGIPESLRGVVITDVDFESEADAKGLRRAMIVTAVNEQPVGDAAEWRRAISGIRPGAPVKLDVMLPGGTQPTYFFLRAPD
jgi:serine protease Do